MTRDQFIKIIMAMAGNFGATIPPITLDAWYGMTKQDGLTYEQVRAAALEIMRGKRDGYGRMPTYAELLEAIRGQAPKIEDVATREANRIIDHLRANGSGQWPVMADQVTTRLMSTRWRYPDWASLVLESELKWWVKEFVEAYRAEAGADDRPVPLRLPENVKGLLEGIG